jgi:5-methylthioadenosine/S-adenosylhomocysteine deaminase
LIKNATIVTVDPSLGVLHRTDLLIENDTIIKIERDISSHTAEVIDASTFIVCPGFIDTHPHTWQTQLKTICTNYSLAAYFANIRNTYASCYTAEDVY